MTSARSTSGTTGGVRIAETCFVSYPLLLVAFPVTRTWPAPGAVAAAVAAPLVAAAVLIARWRRGWTLAVLPGGSTALVVRGLLRTRVLAWDDVVAVSWTPYVGGRSPTWAKTWVLCRRHGRGWAVPVALSGRDRSASRTAAAIWQSAPDHRRHHIGLYQGPPLDPGPPSPPGPDGVHVRAWLDDARWGEIEGEVVFGPDDVRFTTLGRAHPQVWPGARAVEVDLGRSPTASTEVGLLLERPDRGPLWLRVGRRDALTVLALLDERGPTGSTRPDAAAD